MSSITVDQRRVWRRTDDHTPKTPKIQFSTEFIQTPLSPTSVLIKIHAVALNYRDGNIAHGGNPWPVIPKGIPCNDASGEVVAIGAQVKSVKLGDRVAPNTDTKNITGRELERSWLAADEDGVLADYVIFDENALSTLPAHLPWIEASTIPCAGVTAWSSIKGVKAGQTVLIQGTGGVSLFAAKLARASGLRVILSSSNDGKLEEMKRRFSNPPLLTVNYATNLEWHNEVLKLTDGSGVDLVVEIGGNSSLIKSIRCTRRGGIVSLVGYLSSKDTDALAEVLPTLIDRRVNLRGINAGSRQDMDDLCEAIGAMQLRFDDIIDQVFDFDKADEALDYLWQGKHVGKVVVRV